MICATLRLVGIACLLWLPVADSALAQGLARPSGVAGPRPAEQETPKALFRAGLEAYRGGALDRSIELLQRSIALQPRAAALYLLAQVHLDKGQLIEAARAYKRYLRQPDAGRHPERVERAKQALNDLRENHAWLKLHPGLQPLALTIDGLSPTGRLLLLAPGTHRFEITQGQGGPRVARELELSPGRYMLDVHPRAPVSAPSVRLRRSRQHRAAARSTGCALDPICIGPSFTLGLPHLVGVGVQARRGLFGLALDLQASPTTQINKVDAQTNLVSVSLRLFPIELPFFAGVGLSYQYIVGRGTRKGIEVNARAEITSVFFSFGFVESQGWVMGADVSFLIDLHKPNVVLVVPDSATDDLNDAEAKLLMTMLEGKVQRDILAVRGAFSLKHVSPFDLPFQVNFFRVGYMF